MRKLVVISGDLYVRGFLETGALSEIDDESTFFVAGAGMRQAGELERHPRFCGFVDVPEDRENAYSELRILLIAANRRRSKTSKIRLSEMRAPTRLILSIKTLPGIRQLVIRRLFRRIGQNENLRAVVDEINPDIVIAPTYGADPLALDAVRLCGEMNLTSLLLVIGWDNLSSKATFSIAPSYLGVWGDQSVKHAQVIHRIEPERVFPIGVPTFDHYFSFDVAASERPYPFRYAVFAGAMSGCDELTPLKMLEEEIERSGVSDFKIVYRPHPWRAPRPVDDTFHEERFKHVVLDLQVRDQYLKSATANVQNAPASFLPSLDYYPALIGNSEFVITPLSTMMVEAGIFDRRVLVIAYDDGMHELPPSKAFEFEHFRGSESVDGFELCRSISDFVSLFHGMREASPIPRHHIRNQMRQWLYFDDRSYAERVRDLVDEITGRTTSSALSGRDSGRGIWL